MASNVKEAEDGGGGVTPESEARRSGIADPVDRVPRAGETRNECILPTVGGLGARFLRSAACVPSFASEPDLMLLLLMLLLVLPLPVNDGVSVGRAGTPPYRNAAIS